MSQIEITDKNEERVEVLRAALEQIRWEVDNLHAHRWEETLEEIKNLAHKALKRTEETS